MKEEIKMQKKEITDNGREKKRELQKTGINHEIDKKRKKEKMELQEREITSVR